jgi:DNA-binding NarL/FixJ family response regulator
MRVIIADDHPVVRHGLKKLLADEFVEVVFQEAESGSEVLAHVRQRDWDLVLLDVTMPGRCVLEVLRELRQLRPRLPVLVVSMHSEDQYGIRLLNAGASGYVTKDKAPEELISAIMKVMAGGKYVSPLLAERLADHVQAGRGNPLHEMLSDREFAVLRLLANGKTIKEIAQQFHRSVKTISTFQTRILRKLRLRTTVNLVRYALSHRLID